MSILVLMLIGHVVSAQAKRRFSVTDDIALSHFGDIYTGLIEPISFSPDMHYAIVDTERGLLREDRSESTLRVFRMDDIRRFVAHSQIEQSPRPIWVICKSTYKDGPVIANLQWLPDGSGFAFLLRVNSGNYQLYLARLGTRSLVPLTPETQHVTGFAIRDRQHFVYSVLSEEIARQAEIEANAPAIVGTGRSLADLLFTADKYPSLMSRWHDYSDLWAVENNRRFRVEDRATGKQIHLYSNGTQALTLSPDGRSLITIRPVPSIPVEWETEYPPPYPSMPYRIKAGRQDLSAFEGFQYVSEYVWINLVSGEVRSLTSAPTGFSAGWWHIPEAKWSPNGHEVLLSNSFVQPGTPGPTAEKNRPCVVIVDLHINAISCLDRLKGVSEIGHEEGYGRLSDLRFAEAGSKAIVTYGLLNGEERVLICPHTDDGSWSCSTGAARPSASTSEQVKLEINQSFINPPVLIAANSASGLSRTLLDPNPQLKGVELGAVSVYTWKDKTGREWKGGLYKPQDYVPHRSYPLVIQTHGFSESEFAPSGVYPTGLAARELASAGILVLQVPDCPMRMTEEEADCNVAGWEAAVEQLASTGAIDINRVGVIGFSRTCYYVLRALTSSKIHFRAASITDGINFTYFEYISTVDPVEGGFTGQMEKVIGARPFGEGIKQWLTHSPEFSMDKVTAPVQVVANGRCTIQEMWGPYALLRLQQKPVDLIILRSGTHVLTNPKEQFASQSGTVDWFRFWLQGYEDPDASKASQYGRWRQMLAQMPDHARLAN
jgi:dipeptidyl aminopeptidase/acylaminoacyl peptidase